MRKRIQILIPILLIVLGLGVLLYPRVSSWINRRHSSQAIQSFARQMESASEETLQEQLRLAEQYNAGLTSTVSVGASYDEILDFGNGMMGYIEIPAIGVRLPIYHGVSADVLAKGAGHLPQSAFPIGGAGSHTVLTGHTGLPSADLFTDLYQLEPGDSFFLTVGPCVLTYQVDQILTVLPEDTKALEPVPGQDYCTLVTCTPYGINSHRLLVRGSRVQQPAETADTAEAEKSSNLFSLALPIALGILLAHLAFLLWLLLRRRGKRRCPR